MDEQQPVIKYPINEDEKLSPVMVYTSHDIYWGDVIIKKQFRASTWLQTSAVPDVLTLLNGKMIHTLVGGVPRPESISEVHIPLDEIVLFHMTPPESDLIEPDPSDALMQAIKVSINCGGFELDGTIRISVHSTIAQYLAITRESFYSIYDSSIRCVSMPSFGTVKVKFVIARINKSILSLR